MEMQFFTSGTFWFLMGILFVGVAVGAKLWSEDLGVKLNWWKWLMLALWYGLLSITIAASFTLLAENEAKAALGTFGILGVITLILGVGLWRLISQGREAPTETGAA